MPQEEKKVVHPVAIFKESWGLCLKNFKRLAGIYSIIYLPVLAIGLIQIPFLKTAKPNPVFLLLGLICIPISSWGYLALMLFVNKATAGEVGGIGESVRGAGKYFWPYLGATLLNLLFMIGLWATGGILTSIAAALLWKTNKILAILIVVVVGIACVAVTVYFMIRWLIYGALCVTESAGPITALKRSLYLVKGYVNPVIGAHCLIILVYIAGWIPAMVLGAIGGKISYPVGAIYNTVINIVVLPLCATISVVLYRKLKEAVEG